MISKEFESGLQMRSLVTASGELEVMLERVPTPSPEPGEVVIRVEAAPLNPSDIGLVFGTADMGTVKAASGRTGVLARIPDAGMRAMAARVGDALVVGNEGAGTVVAAGESASARALVGRKVAVLAGGMYAQYRTVEVDQCLILPEGTSAIAGASAFVNPLTALGMVETMRREGHRALVHTAAASNLGQMLNRICLKDGIDLVNIVRKPGQVELLKSIGAKHVCDSSSPSFAEELTDALAQTGATLAFDAIGGGRLATQILSGMEAAINREARGYNRYGSSTHKQVYLYGGLDTRPVEIVRNFGMAWGIGGWLLFPFLQKIGPSAARDLKARVAREITTTFASSYTDRISLEQALDPEVIGAYDKRATGSKYVICPNGDQA
jgi:NADPH:quinone reductase